MTSDAAGGPALGGIFRDWGDLDAACLCSRQSSRRAGDRDHDGLTCRVDSAEEHHPVSGAQPNSGDSPAGPPLWANRARRKPE